MPICFPESMNFVIGKSSQESIAILDHYIRYMAEHMEFTMSQMEKRISEIEKKMEDLQKAGA